MPDRIIFQKPDGGVGLVVPAPGIGASLENIAAAAVPDGAPYRLIDAAQLPEDTTYQDAWVCDFDDPASSVVVDPARKAAIDQARALIDLDDWFREVTEPGFATAGGWRLGMKPEDVVLLTGYYVLAKEAAALGGDIPPIIDKDGIPHEIAEIEELTAIMLAYGQRRAEISAEYAAKRAAILGV